MNINVEKQNGLFSLKIEGEMTISTAMELKKGLLDNLEECSELEIDLSRVNEFDTAGFQLLFLIKREANMSNKAFRIVSHSQGTELVLELYNMKEYFSTQIMGPVETEGSHT
jgi:anti-anti-sigma factor